MRRSWRSPGTSRSPRWPRSSGWLRTCRSARSSPSPPTSPAHGKPLYALGRRLLEIIPYVPIASTLRTGVAIFSYCGQVTVGVTGDYDGAADVWTLASAIEDGMSELVAVAEVRAPHPGSGHAADH